MGRYEAGVINFFDPNFNGVDWQAARAQVEPCIAGARTPDEMRRIGSIVRLPRTRITDRNEADMEMRPRPVDAEVKRPIGEGYGGKDSQLDKAVEVLLAQIRS